MKQIKNVKGIENMYFLLLLFITWIILLLRKRKMILSLPYLFMFFVTPIYNVLDSKIFGKYLVVDVLNMVKQICLI